MMNTTHLCFALAIGISLGLHSPAKAVVITSAVNSGVGAGNDTFYDGQISTTDLINVGQPTFSSITSTQPTYGAYTVDGLRNGDATLSAGVAFWVTPTEVTITLDTSVNTLGYDITSLVNINGYPANAKTYANQSFSILYSQVSDPLNFLPLTTVSYLPYTDINDGIGSSMVTLTDTTGVLAANVAAFKLIIPFTTGRTETAVFREFDVFGSASLPPPAPEPSTCAMLGLGVIGLATRRRRRRTAA